MEEHFWFEVGGCRLAGALHRAEGSPAEIGLVLLHGWAGYRVGAHQLFVKLGRAAAQRGFNCLRFDFRGRGDSEGATEDGVLVTMIEDAVAAARELLARTGCRRVVLVGDCSGCEVAIGAGPLVAECVGQVLWSAPLVAKSREGTDRAKRRHVLREYGRKLLRRETWAKALSGGLQLGAIRKALLGGGKGKGEEGAASDREVDWGRRFREFRGQMLFVYGGADPTAAEGLAHYEALCKAARRGWFAHVVEGANHAFYSTAWEREVIEETLGWLGCVEAGYAIGGG